MDARYLSLHAGFHICEAEDARVDDVLLQKVTRVVGGLREGARLIVPVRIEAIASGITLRMALL